MPCTDLSAALFADACVIRLAGEPCSEQRVVRHAAREEVEYPTSLQLPLTAHGRSLGRMWLLRSAARPAFSREEMCRRPALAALCQPSASISAAMVRK